MLRPALLFSAISVASVAFVLLTGCASNEARQSIGRPPGPPASQPAEPGPAGTAPQISQQSGQGNLTAQTDASGWTGIEYSTAVPVGQVILLAMVVILSHLREMQRLRQRDEGTTRPGSNGRPARGPDATS